LPLSFVVAPSTVPVTVTVIVAFLTFASAVSSVLEILTRSFAVPAPVVFFSRPAETGFAALALAESLMVSFVPPRKTLTDKRRPDFSSFASLTLVIFSFEIVPAA
jgi:hypothetical protein